MGSSSSTLVILITALPLRASNFFEALSEGLRGLRSDAGVLEHTLPSPKRRVLQCICTSAKRYRQARAQFQRRAPVDRASAPDLLFRVAQILHSTSEIAVAALCPAIKAGQATFPGPGTSLPGLYCCGDSTQPGIGLPAVAASGMIAANTIAPVWKHWDLLKKIGAW
ncbi:hypothetical protein CYMTET_17753 [Cymbomonas tetramitiformis]|uniref:Carotenoid isomerase n=1 Tax=Cymbomonas tetramitiformis TaxID=36881 RepID=A0AAE0G9S2_9CHLO|nr:hypothetical protein CYMTET_17753 [Cymbomonas tetramitiformis]